MHFGSFFVKGLAVLIAIYSSMWLEKTVFVAWLILAVAAKQPSDFKNLSLECQSAKQRKMNLRYSETHLLQPELTGRLQRILRGAITQKIINQTKLFQ